MTYTQREALHRNSTYGIFFDLTDGNEALLCYQGNPNTVLINPLTKKPYAVDLNHQEGIHDIIITGAQEQGDKYYIEFTPLGEPATKTHITVAVNGENTTYTMHISKIGSITVQ
ncbi:MAG: hypothetical protein ACMUIP_01095 [bacterium]